MRGRLGFVSDRILFYATGGLAVGEVESRLAFSENVEANVAQIMSNNTTKAGWTVGGGIEAALGGNWSVKAEYLYVDLGNRTVSAPNSTATATLPIMGPALVVQNFHARDNIARVGINYLFNAGPVRAAY